MVKIEYWRSEPGGEIGYQKDNMVKDDLAKVGIEIEIKYTDWPSFMESILNGKAPMYGLGWVADIPDPDSFLYNLFHSHGSYNTFNYANPRVDSLLDRGRIEIDSQVRWKIYSGLEKMILGDAPIVPMEHAVDVFAFQPYVKGIEMSGMIGILFKKIWMTNSVRSPTSKVQGQYKNDEGRSSPSS